MLNRKRKLIESNDTDGTQDKLKPGPSGLQTRSGLEGTHANNIPGPSGLCVNPVGIIDVDKLPDDDSIILLSDSDDIINVDMQRGIQNSLSPKSKKGRRARIRNVNVIDVEGLDPFVSYPKSDSGLQKKTNNCVIDITDSAKPVPVAVIRPTSLIDLEAPVNDLDLDFEIVSEKQLKLPPKKSLAEVRKKKAETKVEDRISCPICMSDYLSELKPKEIKMMSTPCGHLFCKPCITKSLKSLAAKCPMCSKKSIKITQCHTLHGL